MKIISKTLYKCEHCGKWYIKKDACEKHEQRCTKNPENHRACHSCHILEKVQTKISIGFNDYYEDEIVSVLFCKEKDCFIYPPSVAYKGNAFDFGDKENVEMPKTCEIFESYGTDFIYF